MLKKILWLLIILCAIPLVLAIFIQQEYQVERSVSIAKPKEQVFEYIRFLRNQEHYGVWSKMDPDMRRSFSGQDGEVGFVSAWDSENPDVGQGEQEIKAIVDGERIDLELRFLAPFTAVEPAYFTTIAEDPEHTKVTWGFSGHMQYPMNLTFLFIDFENMIGKDLEEGLANLKGILEATN